MQTAVKATSDIERTLDSFSIRFNNSDEMLDFHREQDRDSTWIRLPVKQLFIKPLRKEPIAALQIRAEESISAPMETVADTITGVGLLVSDNLGHTYCLPSFGRCGRNI